MAAPRLGLAVTSFALATLLVLPAAGQAAKRPDLVVKSGAVSAAGGKVIGNFVVGNRGPGRARPSTATLEVAGRPIKRSAVPALPSRRTRTIKHSGVALPAGLPAGTHALKACADSRRVVRERSERNNCRTVGTLVIPAPAPAPAPTPAPTAAATPTPAPTPVSSVPTQPIPFNEGEVFKITGAGTAYWIYVPTSYDSSHQTQTPVLVWSHGCYGSSEGDIWMAAPESTGGTQNWISITVDGREYEPPMDGVNDGCWEPGPDQQKLLMAIADLKTHFNVNPKRVVLGGYSSGGDLSYRTAFYNAAQFAGVLAADTSPFRDTGSSQADSLAAAAWKFNVVHLAHTEDVVYPIAGVEQEINAMKNAGFPVDFIKRAGTHYDPDNVPAGTGTNHHIRTLLIPRMNDGWTAP